MLSEVEDLGLAHVKLDDILNDKSGAFEDVLEKARVYSKRLGTDLSSSPLGHIFVNGKHFNLDDVRLRIVIVFDDFLTRATSGFPPPYANGDWATVAAFPRTGKHLYVPAIQSRF